MKKKILIMVLGVSISATMVLGGCGKANSDGATEVESGESEATEVSDADVVESETLSDGQQEAEENYDEQIIEAYTQVLVDILDKNWENLGYVKNYGADLVETINYDSKGHGQFSIADIDSDGRDEMIVSLEGENDLSRVTSIFYYDADKDKAIMTKEKDLGTTSMGRIFDSGYYITLAEHGMIDGFVLEETIHKYDGDNHVVTIVGYTNAYDIEWGEYTGEKTYKKAKKADEDGDGVVYVLSQNDDYTVDGEIVFYDGDAYETALKNFVMGGNEIEVEYNSITRKHIFEYGGKYAKEIYEEREKEVYDKISNGEGGIDLYLAQVVADESTDDNKEMESVTGDIITWTWDEYGDTCIGKVDGKAILNNWDESYEYIDACEKVTFAGAKPGDNVSSAEKALKQYGFKKKDSGDGFISYEIACSGQWLKSIDATYRVTLYIEDDKVSSMYWQPESELAD